MDIKILGPIYLALCMLIFWWEHRKIKKEDSINEARRKGEW